MHEQRRPARGARRRIHHPRVPQKPPAAVWGHDGAEIPVCHAVQLLGPGRQRPGPFRGGYHLLWRYVLSALSPLELKKTGELFPISRPSPHLRPSRLGGRPSSGAAAGEHRSGSPLPPAGQPPRRHLPVPQTAAEAGRPAGAGDGARSAGPGDQDDGGHLAAPAAAGNLQRHVLTRVHVQKDLPLELEGSI